MGYMYSRRLKKTQCNKSLHVVLWECLSAQNDTETKTNTNPMRQNSTMTFPINAKIELII